MLISGTTNKQSKKHMAHELSIVDGKAEMFSGNNEVPWHKLGTVVQGLLTSAEAIEAAHLNWNVQACPITVNGQVQSLEDYQGICRMDTGATLGVMKGRYEIIQNREAFDFMDSLAASGQIKYETAGALRGGKKIWLMAKYDGELMIGSDKTEQWLLLVNSHDGSSCLLLQWVSVRVVCANTLSMALGNVRSQVKIRHTTNWTDKAAEAKRVLGLTGEYFKTLGDALLPLASKRVTPSQAVGFVKTLIPSPADGSKPSTRTTNIRTQILDLFSGGNGNHGNTRYDLLNGVSDYTDHAMTIRADDNRKSEARFESALMASGSELKQRAFDILADDQAFERATNGSSLVVPVSTGLFN